MNYYKLDIHIIMNESKTKMLSKISQTTKSAYCKIPPI